jgi:hypothetical protein
MTAAGDAERYARSCLVEVSPDPLLAIGKAGTITDVNQATRPGGRRAGGSGSPAPITPLRRKISGQALTPEPFDARLAIDLATAP